MNVNGVTSVNDAYSTVNKSSENIKQTTDTAAADVVNSSASEGVIYEPSEEAKNPSKLYKPNAELVAKLKADADAQMNRLQDIVTKLISKQANAFGDANDIWSLLREGKLEVDPETKAQAEADIAEDGYWGVEATSSRIVDFATALTGGDPSKIEAMRDAFKKGYEQAEKTWGGKLPEISQKTYDAVMEKFDKLAEEAAKAGV